MVTLLTGMLQTEKKGKKSPEKNVKIGSIFLVVANQEREKLHLENPVAHDTQAAIKSAVDAIRLMIDDKGR